MTVFKKRLGVGLVFGVLAFAIGCATREKIVQIDENFREPASAEAPLLELPKKKISCSVVSVAGENRREDCVYDTPDGKRTLHVLNLSGNFSDVAYWHGKLLSSEIEKGSLIEALQNVKGAQERVKSPAGKVALRGLFSCLQNKMSESTSSEFRAGISSLYRGYVEGMGNRPAYTEADLTAAIYSIEMGNVAGGLLHRMSLGLGTKAATLVEVAGECGFKVARAVAQDLHDILVEKGALKEKFACTGVVASGRWTSDGRLIHARNLEQTSMIHSWNKHPTLFLVNEKGFHRYVAYGTAGLLFPGGISGFNEKGISVSLHQFSTVDVEASHRRGSAAMLPFLQQRILREADSIDRAIEIIEKTNVFSAWTILVSDAKRNEIASIEISPRGKVVARRWNGVMAQSNAFLSKEKQKDHYHNRYNGLLENMSRLGVVENSFRRQVGKWDLTRMVNLLASHQDFYEKGDRAFGRSVARVSNIMSTISIPEPDRSGGQAWMTIADRLPPIHGHYAGFDVDFKSMKLTPIGAVRTGAFATRPNWERSFEKYHLAYRAHVDGNDVEALRLLDEAIALAAKDKVDDPVYRYVRARFALNQGRIREALSDFRILASGKYPFHPLRKATVAMYYMRASDLAGESNFNHQGTMRKRVYDGAKTAIAEARGRNPVIPGAYPRMEGYQHAEEDLETKLEMWTAIYERKVDPKTKKLVDVKLQDVDMSTID